MHKSCINTRQAQAASSQWQPSFHTRTPCHFAAPGVRRPHNRLKPAQTVTFSLAAYCPGLAPWPRLCCADSPKSPPTANTCKFLQCINQPKQRRCDGRGASTLRVPRYVDVGAACRRLFCCVLAALPVTLATSTAATWQRVLSLYRYLIVSSSAVGRRLRLGCVAALAHGASGTICMVSSFGTVVALSVDSVPAPAAELACTGTGTGMLASASHDKLDVPPGHPPSPRRRTRQLRGYNQRRPAWVGFGSVASLTRDVRACAPVHREAVVARGGRLLSQC